MTFIKFFREDGLQFFIEIADFNFILHWNKPLSINISKSYYAVLCREEQYHKLHCFRLNANKEN